MRFQVKLISLALLLCLAPPGKAQVSGGTVGHEQDVISFTVEPQQHHWHYRLVHSFGSQVKRTFYTDFREHPVSHTLSLFIVLGSVAADNATSCMLGPQSTEIGSLHYFIGRHPSCAKTTFVLSSTAAAELMSVNFFAHEFKNSCDKEAANPDSRWWKTDSHTKSTAACFWGPEIANALAVGAYKYPAIKSNVNILEMK